jgi:hypothetical protein
MVSTLGFLLAGYESDSYYFECVFMFRKALFVFMALVPGAASSNPQDARTIQCAALAIIATIFSAVHWTCQPFERRGMLLFGDLEGAALLAVMGTSFLHLWLQLTEPAHAFRQPSGLSTRKTIVSFCLLLLHGRVLVLALWTLLRVHVVSNIDSNVLWGSLCDRTVKYKVEPMGLSLPENGLGFRQRRLLSMFFAELLALHIDKGGSIRCDFLVASLHRIVVEASYKKAVDESVKKKDYLQQQAEKISDCMVSKLPVGQRSMTTIVKGGEQIIRASMTAKTKSPMDFSPPVVRPTTISGESEDVQSIASEQLEALADFTSENLNRAIGQEFSIEELFGAMTRLGDKAYQAKTCGALEPKDIEVSTKSREIATPRGLDLEKLNQSMLRERSKVFETPKEEEEVSDDGSTRDPRDHVTMSAGSADRRENSGPTEQELLQKVKKLESQLAAQKAQMKLLRMQAPATPRSVEGSDVFTPRTAKFLGVPASELPPNLPPHMQNRANGTMNNTASSTKSIQVEAGNTTNNMARSTDSIPAAEMPIQCSGSAPSSLAVHPPTQESKATSTDDYLGPSSLLSIHRLNSDGALQRLSDDEYRFGDLENRALQEELRNVENARQRAVVGWDRTTTEKDRLAFDLHTTKAMCREQVEEIESLKKQAATMEHDCASLRRWISSLPEGNHHVDEFDSSLRHCLQGPANETGKPDTARTRKNRQHAFLSTCAQAEDAYTPSKTSRSTSRERKRDFELSSRNTSRERKRDFELQTEYEV